MEVLNGLLSRRRPRDCACTLSKNIAPILIIILLQFASFPTRAEDLVDRKIFIEPPTGYAAPSWLLEVLRAGIGSEGGPLLVETAAEADALLAVTIEEASNGSIHATATLNDLLATEAGALALSRSYDLPSLGSAELFDRLGKPLAVELAAVLPPVPQRVRQVVTQRTVENVTTIEKAKGVRIGLRGKPDSRLTFIDGSKAIIGADGIYDFGEVPQYSDIIVTIRAAGSFETKRSFRVGTVDTILDVAPQPFERWAVSLGWSLTSLVPNKVGISLGLVPRHLEVGLGLNGSARSELFRGQGVTAFQVPAVIQPDLSLSVQFLPEDWPFQLWLGGRVLTRFDDENGFGWSKRLRLGFQLPVAAELWLVRYAALRVEAAPLVYFGEPSLLSGLVDMNRKPVQEYFGLNPQGGERYDTTFLLVPGIGFWSLNTLVFSASIKVAF